MTNIKANIKVTEVEEQTKPNPNIKIKVSFKEEDFRNNDNILRTKIVVPMVNPLSLQLEGEIYTIAAKNAVNQVKVDFENDFPVKVSRLEGLTDLQYFAIERHPIEALSVSKEDGKKYVVVNGEVRLPVSGISERNEVDKVFFSDYNDVKELCRVMTKVELDKAKSISKQANNIQDMLKKQLDADLF